MGDYFRQSGYAYGAGGPKAHWPVGTYWIAREDLPGHLADAAQWHARFALRSWVGGDLFGDQLASAISAGTAVELITKSHLATINPVLLAERMDLDTVLRLGGNSTLAKGPATGVRILGCSAALVALKRLHPLLPYNPTSDDVLLRVRNAAVHMALVDRDEVHHAIRVMTRLVEYIAGLGEWNDRVRFWGEELTVVADVILAEEYNDLKARVGSKVAAARAHLSQLTHQLDTSATLAILAALARLGPLTYIEHNAEATCPVCKQRGWLACTVQEDLEEVDTGAGVATRVTRHRAWPAVFECSVCGLNLDGQELLEFSNELPVEIELDLDEADDWEPDEDHW